MYLIFVWYHKGVIRKIVVKRKKEQIREDFCLGTIRYYDGFGKALDRELDKGIG